MGVGIDRYRALDFDFQLTGDAAAVADWLPEALAPLRRTDVEAVGKAEPTFRIVMAAGQASLELFGQCVDVGSPDQVADWLLWEVRRRAAVADPARRLVVHAAAVEMHGTGILIPGDSGSGKSTLAAALVAAGCRYLGDELVAVDVPTLDLLACPMPLRLGVQALSDIGVDGVGPHGPNGKRCLPVQRLTSVPMAQLLAERTAPRLLVVPVVGVGTPGVRRLARARAMSVLAGNLFGLPTATPQTFGVLGALVRACECHRLDFDDVTAGVADLERLVAQLLV